jgi:uncharacterized damage-inducible protein DinB
MVAIMNETDLKLGRRGEISECLPVALEPLIAVLQQVVELIEDLSDEQYARKPVGVVASSIGGHVRHNLDHIESLLNGIQRGLIDYDARQRGTDVETSRQAALAKIERLACRLYALRWESVRKPLRLSMLVDPLSRPVLVLTSVERELAFVMSHTIHHNSLIGVIAQLMGVALPNYFGYAPSTIAHREARQCAR